MGAGRGWNGGGGRGAYRFWPSFVGRANRAWVLWVLGWVCAVRWCWPAPARRGRPWSGGSRPWPPVASRGAAVAARGLRGCGECRVVGGACGAGLFIFAGRPWSAFVLLGAGIPSRGGRPGVGCGGGVHPCRRGGSWVLVRASSARNKKRACAPRFYNF